MNDDFERIPADLPLLLWRTPPGLEMILGQEGVPFDVVHEPHPLIFRGSRFVLFDGRTTPRGSLARVLSPDHVAIDVDLLRSDEPSDPFEALVDTRGGWASWDVGSIRVRERVSRHARSGIRRRLIARLRRLVCEAGGTWICVAPFPYPYRSAFSFRADLDETLPGDYFRFAQARAPLEDCCTHFVSTHAYGRHPDVLRDLEGLDTQSHGHFHHVYREAESNATNLERAHRILSGSGIEPTGFAAPHGRWNAGLDDAIEDLGYLFSSDFQLGYDDYPFFPWKRDRFSRVLQIPVHPICEGLFLDAGIADPREIGEYLARVVAGRLSSGDLAIAYGHPERRLGRMPEVMACLDRAVRSSTLTWRATFTELARWWRWRSLRKWLVFPREDHRLEIQFAEWDNEYAIALEIHRGDFVCSVPATGPRMTLGLAGLAFERAPVESTLPEAPTYERPAPSLREAVRLALDWETATPLAEIPRTTMSNRMKRGLRWWQENRARAGA